MTSRTRAPYESNIDETELREVPPTNESDLLNHEEHATKPVSSNNNAAANNNYVSAANNGEVNQPLSSGFDQSLRRTNSISQIFYLDQTLSPSPGPTSTTGQGLVEFLDVGNSGKPSGLANTAIQQSLRWI